MPVAEMEVAFVLKEQLEDPCSSLQDVKPRCETVMVTFVTFTFLFKP
jgi:hypothetical protein